MLYEEAVAQLRSAEGAGFPISEAQAGVLVMRALRRLASRSRWLKEIRELGPTFAGINALALSEDVIEVLDLNVGGSADYLPVSLRDMRGLQQGSLQIWPDETGACAPGAFAAAYTTGSNTTVPLKRLTIFPTPDVSGLDVNSFCSVMPGTDFEEGDEIPFPDDMDDCVINYARGFAYQDIDENPSMAQFYLDLADTDADLLRRRENSRAGSGPVRIRVRR